MRTIGRLRSDGFDNGGELVANHERALDRRVADASVMVRMQVAAADPRRLHAQQHLAGSGQPGRGHALDAEIARPVQPRRQHGCEVRMHHHHRTRLFCCVISGAPPASSTATLPCAILAAGSLTVTVAVRGRRSSGA